MILPGMQSTRNFGSISGVKFGEYSKLRCKLCVSFPKLHSAEGRCTSCFRNFERIRRPEILGNFKRDHFEELPIKKMIIEEMIALEPRC